MNILITGVAGFIGFHLARRFLAMGYRVTGVDNLNDYYDVNLKKARLAELEPRGNFSFKLLDCCDRSAMAGLFAKNKFDRVLHMAAQAGVRYSLENPHAYIQANIVGFMNILEGCRCQIREGTASASLSSDFRLVYASSSSVYGSNKKLPFSERDNVDQPISLYAATKKSNELMAHTYSHLYGIPTTGLRFFTAYGPWGRPDMALFKFTRAILRGEPIDVYNEGNMRRDFTYIDDTVEAIVLLSKAGSRSSDFRIYNIGNSSPVNLMDFIRAIEDSTGKKAKINYLPIQPGDVRETFADTGELLRDTGFVPKTSVREGVGRFVEWYKNFYS